MAAALCGTKGRMVQAGIHTVITAAAMTASSMAAHGHRRGREGASFPGIDPPAAACGSTTTGGRSPAAGRGGSCSPRNGSVGIVMSPLIVSGQPAGPASSLPRGGRGGHRPRRRRGARSVKLAGADAWMPTPDARCLDADAWMPATWILAAWMPAAWMPTPGCLLLGYSLLGCRRLDACCLDVDDRAPMTDCRGVR